jgi:acid phosphatase type 7
MSIQFQKTLFVAIIVFAAGLAQAAPLHVYLTYSDAPETTVDINIIVERPVKSVVLHFDTQEHGDEIEEYGERVNATYYATPMELSDRRSLYVASLSGLTPGTDYHFIVEEEKYGNSTPRKFRTLPGGTAPIRFVNGGDMGVEEFIDPLLTLAGKTDPDFAVIGGDIAYVNGLLGWYNEWDMWLENWDKMMVTTDGRMIPIVTAIGNHEVNRYVTDNVDLKAPWYLSLFGRQGEEVYFSRKFGENMVLLSLDTGHLNRHDGEQATWLEAELKKHRGTKYKVAAYHVPLYPAHRPYDGDWSALGRKHWAPLFDKYGLTLGMEHHDHVLKRTKPIKNGKVANKGTVYIGDGCFGRGAREIDPTPRWYNVLEGSVPHFWVVDVRESGMAFKAIDHEGETRDEFSLP